MKRLLTISALCIAFIAQAQKPAEVPAAKPATKSEDKNPSFKRELSFYDSIFFLFLLKKKVTVLHPTFVKKAYLGLHWQCYELLLPPKVY
mgnify:CR=1 FL=1